MNEPRKITDVEREIALAGIKNIDIALSVLLVDNQNLGFDINPDKMNMEIQKMKDIVKNQKLTIKP